MKLVVGLGNPGREYVGTRHNVGFEVLDALARRIGAITSPGDFDRQAKAKFDGLALNGTASLGSAGTEKILMLKPTTYMNLSGRSVQAAMAFYQVATADVMVVLDDMALPCGKIRMRPVGSDGGHNGLRDIQRALGTQKYGRLRVGVDTPPPMIPWRDYVLQKFGTEQRQRLEPAIDKSTSAILAWMEKGIEPAMSQFNANDE